MNEIFGAARWVWAENPPPNPYVALAKTVALPDGGNGPVCVRVTASSFYELYLNGEFIGRGPVYGDPQWCLYDEWEYTPDANAGRLRVLIVAHNATAPSVLALRPAPGGVLASFVGAGGEFGTDETWKCVPLPMWASDAPKRGWAMDCAEDYDATCEPEGWQDRILTDSVLESAPNAVPVADAATVWLGYEPRYTPYLRYNFIPPIRFSAFRADGPGAEAMGDVAPTNETEPLMPVEADIEFSPDTVNALRGRANVFTFDLGREYIGHLAFEVDAPEGVTLELSGAELLRDGRPWIVRKGQRDAVRYRTREGRQQFHAFGWTGCRYLHLVIRGGTEGVTLHRVGLRERRVPLPPAKPFHTEDAELQAVFGLCRRTLEVGAQEHLIDCPTREQAQYWGDAVFIAQSLWRGFGETSYLRWYLDCFLHVPFNEIGQITSVYPGNHSTFPDYSLIPLLGQRFCRENTGHFYRVGEMCDKALRLKRWYDERRDAAGLVSLPSQTKEGNISVVTFIDHPSLGWHDFPHRGIDREGVSAPLNLFYYNYLNILSEMLAEAGREGEGLEVRQQAESLGAVLRERFFDGTAFHDAWNDGAMSEGTSWQTNSLAVYFGLVQGEEATTVMQTMLDRYDTVCRCSPYFHFYFLPALRVAGLHNEARELIKREWRPMLEGGATTTWEGFWGDAKDTLCHPWSTAPFLHLITEPG